MKKYALIGYPLGHSLSPQIHTRLMELCGIEGSYEKLEISPERLKDSFSGLSELDGFNVTIPHKINIIPYCDRLDASAESFGSVNCVKNGAEKVGYNTDVIGFERSVEMLGASLNSRVLVIGLGGVGRMIAAQSAYKGGRVTAAVLPEFYADAEKTVSDIKKHKPDADIILKKISGEVLSGHDLDGDMDYDLLVNASPVGMFPDTGKMPCYPEILGSIPCVFDVVYNPRETLLVKTARENGKRAMAGMAMLVLQAAAAQEIWNGVSFKDEDMKRLISDMEELL